MIYRGAALMRGRKMLLAEAVAVLPEGLKQGEILFLLESGRTGGSAPAFAGRYTLLLRYDLLCRIRYVGRRGGEHLFRIESVSSLPDDIPTRELPVPFARASQRTQPRPVPAESDEPKARNKESLSMDDKERFDDVKVFTGELLDVKVFIQDATAVIEGPPEGGREVKISGGTVVDAPVEGEKYHVTGNSPGGNKLDDKVQLKGYYFVVSHD
ncbi:MAG TPA: hypothetical protein VL025_10005 [Thermoanaerobaculia bacterium]|nr:hypothetical protein [Thermoanaerobaculia bacterium]